MGNETDDHHRWHPITPDQLNDATLRAEGAGASVFEATLRTTDDAQLDGASVAVRRPRITSSVALFRFEAELSLRSRLSHPNVLPLLGACTRAPEYFTVSPWMAGGTLFDVIHTKGISMSFERLLRLTLQLAHAIRYLHAARLVHRDIKSSNILLDRKWENLVLSDLDLLIGIDDLQRTKGRALNRGPSNGRLSHMVGTLIYMAPETLSGQPHDFAADAYAFAITINEMCSVAVPFIDKKLPIPELHTVLETRFNEVKLRGAIVRDHLRPSLASGVAPDFRSLIEDCWQPDPARRPTFDDIVDRLQALIDKGSEYLGQFYGSTMPSTSDSTQNEINNANMDGSTLVTQSSSERAETLMREFQQAMAHPQLPIWHKGTEVTANGDSVSEESKSATNGAPRTAKKKANLDINGALSSTSGERGEDCMEDRSIVIERATGLPDTYLYGVFDGHAGQRCAEFARQYVPGALYRIWGEPEATPESTLIHAFEDTDTAFLHAHEDNNSGCTALVVLVVGGRLHVANAGDSRCVLAKVDGRAVALSKDHVATDDHERLRIEARGGFVSVTGRAQGCLMVSRAFGDRAVKQYISATPEVVQKDIDDDDDFIILASDGLWDVVKNQQAVDLVRSTVRVPDMAAKRLALKAIELGSDDNISVIVVFLRGIVSMHSS